MDFSTAAHKGWGGSVYPHFDAVICTGCGQTRFFLRAGDGNLLDNCHHEIVDGARVPGYR